MAKKLITAALPYANGSIHIGHLVEYVQADIMARFLRLTGDDVLYICASDTHGTPIEVNAKKLGIKPEELVKKFNKEHKDDFSKFLIKFDHYYTTHSKENKELSEYFFNTLNKNGHIYTKEINVIFCPNCVRSLPDRFVRGTCPHCTTLDQYGDVCENCGVALKGVDLIDPKCSICSSTPEQKMREHYFFKLKSFEKQLQKWLSQNKNVQKEIKNHINGWLKKGLEDWCISRDGPYFGFTIPGEKDKYFYVWLDAPIGYISSTKHFTKKWKDYWQKDSEIIHFIGKDIIYFHFLFWPAMLMGVGFTLPKDIVVHGFLTVNGKKMSKSRGTFFTAQEFLKLYGPEHLRFYYASHLVKKLVDIDLDFDDFLAVVNNVLIGNVANFCYRVLSFIEKQYDGDIKEIADDKVVKKIEKKLALVKKHYASYNVKEAVSEILKISDLGNSFFQNTAPWKDKLGSKSKVGLAANLVRVLSIVLSPILPGFSSAIQKQLGDKNLLWDDISFDKRIKVKNSKIIFTKIEKVAEAATFPLDLRVCKVLNVKDHPNADSLYVVEIDLGDEKRTLVAGLKKYYTKKELTGKKLTVCVNLEPATIRGVKSCGMLLAADDDERVVMLELDKSSVADHVKMHGFENSQKQISFKEFMKLGLKVVEKKVVWKDSHLHTSVEDVEIDLPNGSKVR